MFILSQPVPLTGTGVLYPRVRDFLLSFGKKLQFSTTTQTYLTHLTD